MNIKRDERIDGEYDPPLPERPEKPRKEDIEKLEKLLRKHPQLRSEFQHFLEEQ